MVPKAHLIERTSSSNHPIWGSMLISQGAILRFVSKVKSMEHGLEKEGFLCSQYCNLKMTNLNQQDPTIRAWTQTLYVYTIP